MHNYYRAIGFGRGYLKPVLRNIIKKAVDEYKEKNTEDTRGKLIEIYVQFDKYFGLIIHGEFINETEFEIEYTFPVIKPSNYTLFEDISVEKNAASYSFSAICDNKDTGTSIIFYLQNALDYVNKKFPENISSDVGFAGLSLGGKIILPTKEYEGYNRLYNKLKSNKIRMIADAQKGDENAIENLTIDEMNVYTKISKRIQNEDVLSIVDTSFMPFGVECDRYSIIGKILNIEESINRITKEKIFYMTLECNDVILNVGIHEDDVIGEPMIGRRFKGNVWLQGNIRFT